MNQKTEQTDGSDYGTDEQLRKLFPEGKKAQAMEVPTEAAGRSALQILEECFLDSLYRQGKLRAKGEPQPPRDDEARRRLQAGLWLRSLYHKAGMQKRVTMAYSVFGQGGHGEEMSDVEAWNWRCWRETMRELGQWAIVCRAVCCFDHYPPGGWWDLKSGLDRLADIRGM